MKPLHYVALFAGAVAIFGATQYKTPAQKLVELRSPDTVCTTDSKECELWTKLMLGCEQGTSKTCAAAENYREAITGVELSTAPNAFNF
jgi:hypothetical protein